MTAKYPDSLLYNDEQLTLAPNGGVIQGVTAFGKSKKHSAKIKDK